MKNKSYLQLCYLPLLLLLVAFLPACKKDAATNSAPPVIASIKSYVVSPNDTVLNSAVAKGQWVVITGQNLQNATQINFDGVAASFNAALFAPNSAVVQIPNIEFSKIDTTKLYTVEYATAAGTTTFAFKLGPPAPTLSAISDVFAAPGDSVYLYGSNLVLVQQLSYGGTKIPKFNSNANGTALGFLMPATTSDKFIVVTTKGGTARDTINAKPIIAAISNGNPDLGDSVYVYGAYLKTVQSISFGGATITNFTEGPRGAYVKFLAPGKYSYASGPVTIVTSYGTVSTPYKVNTQNGVTDGLLANFEWGDNFGYAWWGDEKLAFGPVAAFNGSMGTNNTMYIYFDSPVLAGGASAYAPLGNSNTGNHWVPVASITDPPSQWALQFEISVAHPWNGGTLYIRTEFAGDSYVARYEPWKIPGSNKTVAFQTKGWQTVTIPLSEFRSKVNELGDGESVTKLNQLLGPTGANSYNMTLKNFGSSTTATGCYAAIDNIRCVKIK
ncbi:glycan-binding surface protein [Mucilaginibacter sp.]|uniref:glycan-binding surface protein n=1 Tax=Mucilaginibacter sp. TaxID=1882438 RepID=UPI0032656F7A